VAPTGDMLIRRGNNVDVSGLCQFDYLRQWTVKPEVPSCKYLFTSMITLTQINLVGVSFDRTITSDAGYILS